MSESSPFGPVVLEHFRRPRNRGPLADADVSREGANPLCGDRIRVQVRLRDGRVEAAGFTADACAICVAAASLLTERVRGLPVADARAIGDGEIIDALAAPIPPARLACAVLPVATLRSALDEIR